MLTIIGHYEMSFIPKIRIRERDCENCKVGRQTSECEATLIWTRKKERRLRGKKDDGDGSARQKEKRKAKEKVDGFGGEDMERVGAREGDEVDQVKWRLLSRCGDPKYGEAERRIHP